MVPTKHEKPNLRDLKVRIVTPVTKSVTKCRFGNALLTVEDAQRIGQYPVASMIVLKAALYTTTLEGGGNGCGTVFNVRKSGVEQVLHRFKCSPDGAYAFGLTAINRVLYGRTTLGGNHCNGTGNGGCGTVFDLSTSEKASVLYSFRGAPDGNETFSLLAVKGTLYGATVFGGSGKCIYGCGTIFKVTP